MGTDRRVAPGHPSGARHALTTERARWLLRLETFPRTVVAISRAVSDDVGNGRKEVVLLATSAGDPRGERLLAVPHGRG